MSNVTFFAKLRFACLSFIFFNLLPSSGHTTPLYFFDRCTIPPLFVADTPGIQCPADRTVSCVNFDPSLKAYGEAHPAPSVTCVDSSKVYNTVKGITHQANYSQFDTICNRGTILRTFTVYDCLGNTNRCTQSIVVSYDENYYVQFPDDRIVTACDAGGQYGAPVFYGEDCELLASSFKDDTFTVVPDACYKVERTWKVINWCTFQPDCKLTVIPNPTPNVVINNAANLKGPVVSDLCNAPLSDPWRSTKIKISPVDPTETDYCTFWQRPDSCGNTLKFNGYQYTQIIKIVDGKPPVPQCTKPDTCDVTGNDPLFWNVDYWWDPTLSLHDLAEMPIDLKLTATDLCSGPNINFRYLLFLDLDANGTMETVISSEQLPPTNTVYYGNALLPNYQGGTARAFDHRPVINPALDWYRFAMQVTRSGNNATAAVRFNTARSPNTYALPQLPHGRHKIRWIVEDGCGNETVCEYTFTIKDCQKPTVVCKPLSVNIMGSGMVTLWAPDFLEYVTDNCTPEDKIKLAISKGEPAPATFPRDPVTRLPITQVNFTCADLGPNVIQLWGEDAAGNAGYCQVVLLVQDNIGNCTPKASLSGTITTPLNKPLPDAQIQMGGTHPAYPPIFISTNNMGQYSIPNAIPLGSNYTICPEKSDDPLGGITTIDLALIYKHILGATLFDSPFKMIAADANRSGTITSFDVVELRKLILGIYSELPNNTVWRFVAKRHVFSNPANPFQAAIPGCLTVGDLLTAPGDFIGIKVGDVNYSFYNNFRNGVEDRAGAPHTLALPQQTLEKGAIFEVPFRNEAPLLAQQFSLSFPQLELLDIIPDAAGVSGEHFARFPAQHRLSHAWNSEQEQASVPAFTLRFKALASGRLSDMLSLSDTPTPAQAYASDQNARPLALRFEEKGQDPTALQLLQNQPNPFDETTIIGFFLPQAENFVLSIFDENGRTLYQQKGQGTQGYNQCLLDQHNQLPKGILLYRLETAGATATRKMLRQ